MLIRFSQATSYALQALLVLAARPPGARVASHEIAKEYGIPERYLLKALQRLAQGGVVRASKGPGGGYRLTRPAAEITLLDTIACLEPELLKSEPGRAVPCLQQVAAEVREAARGLLAQRTLADCLAAGPAARPRKR